MEEEEVKKSVFPLPSPSLWLSKFLTLQSDIFYTCFIALLSPFISFLSLFSGSFRPEKTEDNVQLAVQAATNFPSKVVRGGSLLLKKVWVGFLAAVYVCMVLTVLLVVSFILGIGMVQFWVDQPVILRERLHFDYTQVQPEAVFAFDVDYGGFEGCRSHRHFFGKKVGGVPVGHTFYVSLVLLVPESDYNREIGIFQLTAEVISSNGEIMEKASHPCMLRFRSWPIRITRTFLMGIPLLLGITAETQTMKVAMLKHKEDFPRSAAIRIILSSRAGTDFLPQVYDAQILVNSKLPWKKEVVRRWKWTFCVWTSMYVYTILLVVALSFFRQLILPVLSRVPRNSEQNLAGEAAQKTKGKSREESADISQSQRRWHRRRSKRKAMILQMDESGMPEAGGSSATSISITREDTGMSLGEDASDSESVCYRA